MAADTDQRPAPDPVIEERVERWEKASEIPLTISTLLFLGAYAWPILDPDLNRAWDNACETVVWVTWVMVFVDLAARVLLARHRWKFIREHPLDVAVVVLPILRPLRLLRLVTLLSVLNRYAGSSMRGKVGLYLVSSVSLIVFVSAVAILDVERGGDGPIQSFGDAVWWAMTTITTVGYGDMYPVTTAGRFIAGGLMFAGIATLGVVTASFASWLIERVAESDEETEAATRRDIAALTAEIRTLREELRKS
ncbi:potassium channel family protein [Aeromicrobium sp. CF3.5]|uniref:potassium channel family protein n=1 Tax=Aeromicrobium sp. CF3.5 TaxID=3373078 RepID=UPI003EE448AE